MENRRKSLFANDIPVKPEPSEFKVVITSGAPGDSAYNIWVNNGNEGKSEEDFIEWMQAKVTKESVERVLTGIIKTHQHTFNDVIEEPTGKSLTVVSKETKDYILSVESIVNALNPLMDAAYNPATNAIDFTFRNGNLKGIDMPDSLIGLDWDEATNEIVMTDVNGNETRIPLNSIVQGLASEVWVQGKLDLKENAVNKISGWGAVPDNTQYPSAKLVNDTIAAVRQENTNQLALKADKANTMLLGENGKLLDITGQNIRDITKSGLYMGYGVLNAPGEGWFFFDVKIHNELYRSIRATQFTEGRVGRVYEQLQHGGVYQPWKVVPFSDETVNLTDDQIIGGAKEFNLPITVNGRHMVINGNNVGGDANRPYLQLHWPGRAFGLYSVDELGRPRFGTGDNPQISDEILAFKSQVDGKLDRQQNPTDQFRLYGQAPGGSDRMYNISNAVQGNTVPLSTSTGQIKMADGVGTNEGATIGQLNGKLSKTDLYKKSSRDFPNGMLITTSMGWDSGMSWLLTIEGNTYTNQIPFLMKLQGYQYLGDAIQVGGWGTEVRTITLLKYNNNVAFWMPRGGYWEGFNVRLEETNGAFDSSYINYIHSISDSSLPAAQSGKLYTRTLRSFVALDGDQSVDGIKRFNSGLFSGYYSGSSPAITLQKGESATTNFTDRPRMSFWWAGRSERVLSMDENGNFLSTTFDGSDQKRIATTDQVDFKADKTSTIAQMNSIGNESIKAKLNEWGDARGFMFSFDTSCPDKPSWFEYGGMVLTFGSTSSYKGVIAISSDTEEIAFMRKVGNGYGNWQNLANLNRVVTLNGNQTWSGIKTALNNIVVHTNGGRNNIGCSSMNNRGAYIGSQANEGQDETILYLGNGTDKGKAFIYGQGIGEKQIATTDQTVNLTGTTKPFELNGGGDFVGMNLFRSVSGSLGKSVFGIGHGIDGYCTPIIENQQNGIMNARFEFLKNGQIREIFSGKTFATTDQISAAGISAATQAEVDAGAINNKAVTPLTLKNSTLLQTEWEFIGVGTSVSIGNKDDYSEFYISSDSNNFVDVSFPSAVSQARSMMWYLGTYEYRGPLYIGVEQNTIKNTQSIYMRVYGKRR